MPNTAAAVRQDAHSQCSTHTTCCTHGRVKNISSYRDWGHFQQEGDHTCLAGSWQITAESQDILSWEGPTRITKSNSRPHTGPPKKPKPYIQECCPNTSRAPAGQCIWGNSKYHTTQMVGWSYRQILFMAQCVPSIAQLLCGSEKGKEKRLWLLPVILTPVTINTVFCFPTVLLNCPRFADGFLMVCWITCSIPDISKVVNYGPMMSTYVKS